MDLHTEQSLASAAPHDLPLKPPSILSIAGSDPSGGAGILADVKTIAAHGLYAQAVPTVLTAQNTLGVYEVLPLNPVFVRMQIETVFADIVPKATKVGMVGNAAVAQEVARSLQQVRAHNVVVDPIMVSSTGTRLLEQEAIETVAAELFPLAALITPNIPEAETLLETAIEDASSRETAARRLALRYGCSVLIKGGHDSTGAADCLAEQTPDNIKIHWFCQERIPNADVHGTGCALSSAIACELALGCPLDQSVQKAKQYLTSALRHPLGLGRGTSPVNHFWKTSYR